MATKKKPKAKKQVKAKAKKVVTRKKKVKKEAVPHKTIPSTGGVVRDGGVVEQDDHIDTGPKRIYGVIRRREVRINPTGKRF